GPTDLRLGGDLGVDLGLARLPTQHQLIDALTHSRRGDTRVEGRDRQQLAVGQLDRASVAVAQKSDLVLHAGGTPRSWCVVVSGPARTRTGIGDGRGGSIRVGDTRIHLLCLLSYGPLAVPGRRGVDPVIPAAGGC